MVAKMWRIMLMTALAVSVVACGDDEQPETGTSGGAGEESGDGGTSAGDPVRIGVLLELSGPAAAFGESSERALQIAVDELNAAGGVTVDGSTHDIELVVVDNETDPSAAVAGAQQLIVDEGVNIVIGPVTSSLAPGVAQAITPRGALMISDAPSLDELIAGDAVESTGQLIFRSLYPAQIQAHMAATGILKVYPDAERVAIIAPDDGSGRAGSVSEIADVLADSGVDVVAEEFVPATATDFQTVLTRVRDQDPDVLFVCCTPGTVGGLVRQSVELGLDASFMFYSGAPLSVALEDAIGEQVPVDAAVTYLPSALERLPSGEVLTAKPGVEAFAAGLEERGVTIDSTSALGLGFFYDTIALLAAAMEQAGSTDDTEAIAAALEEVTVEGVNGTIGFGPDHAWDPPADVCVARAGNPVPECVQVEAPN